MHNFSPDSCTWRAKTFFFTIFKFYLFLKFLFLHRFLTKLTGMKKIILPVILIVLVFGLTRCQKSTDQRFYDKRYVKEIKEARKELFYYMSRNFVPGGSFAIAKNGKLIYSEGMGYASSDLEVPASRHTKFRIGPLSELFTSLAYLQLVEKGTLHPDSSVLTYVKNYPEQHRKITLDHLANHTSGIREPQGDEEEWRALNVSIAKGIEQFQNEELLFEPGMFNSITMFNYNLLGLAMEQSAGEKFTKMIGTLIDTLGLKNTEFDQPFGIVKGRSDFYDHNIIAQVVNAMTMDFRYKSPSNGLLSNAEDLVKFAIEVLHSGYISDSIREKLFSQKSLSSGTPTNFSNGWFVSQDMEGRRFYGRTGSVTGGGAALLIFPDEDLIVAAAINLTADMEELPVFQMAKPFLPSAKKDAEDQADEPADQTNDQENNSSAAPVEPKN